MAQTYEDKPTLAAWNAMGSARGFELVKSVTAESSCYRIELDVSDVDWSHYSLVVLLFHLTGSQTRSISFSGAWLGDFTAGCDVIFQLFPMYNAGHYATYTNGSGTATANLFSELTYAALTRGNSDLAAGSSIELWVQE